MISDLSLHYWNYLPTYLDIKWLFIYINVTSTDLLKNFPFDSLLILFLEYK